MDTKKLAYRMQLTAFFHTEYVYRFLENQKFSDQLLSDIHVLQSFMREVMGEYYDVHDIDFILDYHEFIQFSDSKTDLFRDLLNKRTSLHVKEHTYNTPSIQEIHRNILSQDSLAHALSRIASISFKYGVYAAHVATFKSKHYSIEMLNYDNISHHTERLYFKKSIAEKLLCPAVIVTDPGESCFAIGDSSKHGKLAFHIDLDSKEYKFESAVEAIKSIMSLYIYENDSGMLTNDYGAVSYYLNMFFPKTMHRVSTYEAESRLIGIIMYDYVKKNTNMNITAVAKHFCKNLIRRPNLNCTKEDNFETCENCDNCLRYYNKLYRVACKSVDHGCICISK